MRWGTVSSHFALMSLHAHLGSSLHSRSFSSLSFFFFLSLHSRESASLRLLLCSAAMRIMRETHAPDAVSLKTAYSGVKFEILISKKPIQFRPAYNQLTDRQTNQPTNPLDFCIPPFPPFFSSWCWRFFFLALFLSHPRSHAGAAWRRDPPAAQKPQTFQLMRPQDRRPFALSRGSFFVRALIALCDFTATKTHKYLRIAVASLAFLRKIQRF